MQSLANFQNSTKMANERVQLLLGRTGNSECDTIIFKMYTPILLVLTYLIEHTQWQWGTQGMHKIQMLWSSIGMNIESLDLQAVVCY
jgi:hypothetical protein